MPCSCNRLSRRSPSPCNRRGSRSPCEHTARALDRDAGLLGPSVDAVKSYLDRVDVAVTSLVNDVIAATAAGKSFSPRFLTDWNLFVAEWRAYYAKNYATTAALLGGSEIVSETENYEKRLEGFRSRYTDETKLSPTMKPTELPGPPTPLVGGSTSTFNPTGLVTGLAVLAAIVVLGPPLARRL